MEVKLVFTDLTARRRRVRGYKGRAWQYAASSNCRCRRRGRRLLRTYRARLLLGVHIEGALVACAEMPAPIEDGRRWALVANNAGVAARDRRTRRRGASGRASPIALRPSKRVPTLLAPLARA
eukprot:scaffold6021_cov117-Isochrysis_galbana.AAC.1